MNRGEIRWYTFRPPDKRRPFLGATLCYPQESRWAEVRRALLDACSFEAG